MLSLACLRRDFLAKMRFVAASRLGTRRGPDTPRPFRQANGGAIFLPSKPRGADMDYAHLSYERLVGMRQLLEVLIERGDASSDALLQLDMIKTEMETRPFRLIGRYAGGT